MKRALIAILLLVAFSLPAIAADQPKTEQEKLGYAIGMNIGMNMKQQQVDVDPNQVAAGIIASLNGEKTELSQEQMGKILADYQQKMQMKQMEEMASAAAENEKLGTEYLAANAKKDGVITLESGLQYKILTSGEGTTPAIDSNVEVHYRGTLIDGTEFDSSYSRGTPASFPVNGVIPGWTEALQLMKEGDKWELVIPSQLAYAERGRHL